MKSIERKWWFVAIVALLSTLITFSLLGAAGLPAVNEYRLAHWLVYGLCFGAVWRVVSLALWSLTLLRTPKRSQ